ncbi:Sensors of blue-light using FAD [Marinobacter daqiaonensis]|uniref:Sensors of blue-light using FAD n=1 Tax=Marinobacter daqiaonensis TaxID=650891 RepID=A0A1I6HE72_9GAMM|nr:BLUF domain-containing protein [Marinobacter daqiaonensis]SFR52783.1 Sensors of blue-light using FAD [Marinobacter daqiaonensis]
MSLIRLAYASEATFKPQPAASGVEPHVARILLASRRNNPKYGIVGGLYYGNHHFFQYLEGEEDQVRELYGRIRRDERHRNITTLLEEPLDEVTFTDWSMKYVPQAEDVTRILKRHDMDQFRPELFDRAMCEEMISVIRESHHHDRLINHHAGVRGESGQVIAPGIRNGLILAAVVLVGALLVGGLLLL